ncbi:hypothetical protein C8J57DRAFT_1588186 [Mycena rebaudengoi]|nr:hypothetical protein C8J57DRAFT_1588186 [Mycena rebaudengoi]
MGEFTTWWFATKRASGSVQTRHTAPDSPCFSMEANPNVYPRMPNPLDAVLGTQVTPTPPASSPSAPPPTRRLALLRAHDGWWRGAHYADERSGDMHEGARSLDLTWTGKKSTGPGHLRHTARLLELYARTMKRHQWTPDPGIHRVSAEVVGFHWNPLDLRVAKKEQSRMQGFWDQVEIMARGKPVESVQEVLESVRCGIY